MKLFIDTANIEEIKEINEWGILEGVTTNPSLIAKEGGVNFEEVIAEITEIVDGPISAEVIGTRTEEMLEEAHKLAKISDNIVVKIPMLPSGLAAVRQLSAEGIKTNVTLVFSANQALLAAKAGATYVSPFVGRLDDIGSEGIPVVADIVDIFTWYDLDAEIISASIRNPQHVLDSARAGADIATVPYEVFKKMVSHPKTDEGLESFISDWEQRG
ncbi:MAG: fructose-6-phosphate aldolase [Bacillota bacterium]